MGHHGVKLSENGHNYALSGLQITISDFGSGILNLIPSNYIHTEYEYEFVLTC